MNYLSHYTQDLQTELFKSTGAFFAFSQDQLEKGKLENGLNLDNSEYSSLGAGMVCPKSTVKELIEGLDSIQINGIKADIAENGIKAIIHRELGNHEAQITGDIDNTVDSLEGYPITRKDVQTQYSSFYQLCIDNDWF
tara:strand:+ start:288 stop:701 length:414 start_codon:yes stop_codon:yes gene_type:complete